MALSASPASAAPVRATVLFPAEETVHKPGYLRVQNGILPIALPHHDPRGEAVVVLLPQSGAAPSPPAEATRASYELKLSGLRLVPSVVAAPPGATVVLRNEDRVPHNLSCPSAAALLPAKPLPPGGKLSITLPAEGELQIVSADYPHLTGLLLVTRGAASRVELAIGGQQGTAQLDVPEGSYQAKLFYQHRFIASEPVTVTAKGAEVTLSAPVPANAHPPASAPAPRGP